MVHPNYVEEQPKVPAALEPTGSINCLLYTEQVSNHFYRQWVDLQSEKQLDSISIYVPKITTLTFRPKLALNIWSYDQNG